MLAGAAPYELVPLLRAPFTIEEHEIRVGEETKDKQTGNVTRIRWLVYVQREAIITRLDDLLPLSWSFETDKPEVRAGYISVVGRIRINGLARDNNGGWSARGDEVDENTEKAAMTDCFKRCASSWGIGLYLQNVGMIWTDGYTKGDWNAKRKREEEAWGKFEQWYKREYQNASKTEKKATPRGSAQSEGMKQPQTDETAWNQNEQAASYRYWTETLSMGDKEIFQALGGIKRLGEWTRSDEAARQQVSAWLDQKLAEEMGAEATITNIH